MFCHTYNIITSNGIKIKSFENLLLFSPISGQIVVPDEGHKVPEENPVLHRDKVEVDDLRNCPNLPVYQHSCEVVIPDIRRLSKDCNLRRLRISSPSML